MWEANSPVPQPCQGNPPCSQTHTEQPCRVPRVAKAISHICGCLIPTGAPLSYLSVHICSIIWSPASPLSLSGFGFNGRRPADFALFGIHQGEGCRVSHAKNSAGALAMLNTELACCLFLISVGSEHTTQFFIVAGLFATWVCGLIPQLTLEQFLVFFIRCLGWSSQVESWTWISLEQKEIGCSVRV